MESIKSQNYKDMKIQLENLNHMKEGKPCVKKDSQGTTLRLAMNIFG